MRPQEKALVIGKYGCLGLAYIEMGIRLIGKSDNSIYDPLLMFVEHFDELVKKGIMTTECYILNAEAFLEHIFERKFTVTKSSTNPGEWCVATNNQHFVIVDKNDKIVWNSLDNDTAWYRLPIKSYRVVEVK